MGTASKKNDIQSSRWSALRAAEPTRETPESDTWSGKNLSIVERFAERLDYGAPVRARSSGAGRKVENPVQKHALAALMRVLAPHG
jgi:hypothetical protein